MQLNYLIIDAKIELVVFQLGSYKSPGPDGIPAFFYQEYWNIVKQDILGTLHAFFHSGTLLKSLNKTFITLVPKIPIPEEVSHFRTISLCNVTYKIISKIMVSRLKPLMDKLISHFQNAFIQGRSITDNILLAHEIIYFMKKKRGRKKGYGALKIDICKVVLTSMNFTDSWIQWIMMCVSSIEYSLLLNGSPTQPFTLARGIRQDDPISPFLLLLPI